MPDDRFAKAEYLTPEPVQQYSAPPNAVRRQVSVVTITLIALNVLVFVAMVAKGLSFTGPSGEDLIPWGANFGPLTLNGQWWRLFTAMFLHFGIIHLGFNMFVLYQVGMTTELIYGRAKYLLIYVLSGVMGNIASLYLHPQSVGAGASGAIFGVYGAFLGFLLMRRRVIAKPAMAQMVRSAGIFLGINLIYGLSSPSTDLSAHIGGLVIGFALGCFLSTETPRGVGR